MFFKSVLNAFLIPVIFRICLASNDIVYKDDLKIVGGNLSDLHQFPYQVGIFLHKKLDRDYSFCGGSIISEEFILTAARCFKSHSFSTINILFGARNLSNWEPGYQYRTLRVNNETVFVHEEFKNKGYKNDIALIKLKDKLIFDDGIKPVGLPDLTNVNNQDYVGQIGTIAGWGFYKEDEFAVSPQMNYVQVPVISNQDCKAYNDPFDKYVESSNLCTSGDLKGLCEADYGGALVINGTQVGIMSWYDDDDEDCFLSRPSVYTKISAYRNWIREKSGV